MLKQSEALHGYWLTDDYLTTISKSKSVYANRNYKSAFYGFILDKENLQTDSANLAGFTEHEGGYDAPLIFDTQKNKFIKNIQRVTEYASKAPLELNSKTNDRLEIFYPTINKTDVYRKVIDDQTELRRILFEGKYRSIDSQQVFSFDQTGLVTGFGNNVRFDVVYDFGEGVEYDAVLFFDTVKGGNWNDADLYQYKFASDTLKLYKVETNWEELKHKVGPLSLELVKVKE